MVSFGVQLDANSQFCVQRGTAIGGISARADGAVDDRFAQRPDIPRPSGEWVKSPLSWPPALGSRVSPNRLKQ